MAGAEAGLSDVGWSGCMTGDVLALHDEREEGEPLVHPVLCGGKRLHASIPLSASCDRAARQLEQLPERLRKLDQAAQPFKVKSSPGLQSLALAVDEQSRWSG